MEYLEQAKSFLETTNTTFKAEYLEHGLHFEGDKEKRAIYKITLSNKEGEFCFDFGQSIEDSFKKEMGPQRDILETINVYAGLETASSSCGHSFKLKKEEGFNLSDVRFQELASDLETEYYRKISNRNEKLLEKFNKGEISRNLMNAKKDGGNLGSGAFTQCIQNAIKRELNKEVETAGEFLQITPTEYDVLTCLTKYDPETFEDFCSEFGYDEDSRKAEKIYKAVVNEYNNVAMLWNDSEIELLSEIQ